VNEKKNSRATTKFWLESLNWKENYLNKRTKKNQKNENQIGKIIYYKFGLNDIIENQ
jgi:hypothetical protein